ncbi:MAG: hypothetical protein GF393_05340, partial [Armatimonadia bacterium]|nr:hypothetical protein [Armatimonadia bacterium]
MVSRGAVVAAVLALTLAVAGAQQADRHDLAHRVASMHSQMMGGPDAVTLTIAEGPDLTGIALGDATVEDNTATWRADGLTVTRSVAQRNDRFARDIELSFRNDGNAQRLLDVTCSVPAMLKDARWWDGRVQRAPAPAEFLRNDFLRAPISAAIG